MADPHSHGAGHPGHEDVHAEVAIIPEKSWQDGLLVLVCIVAALALVWCGLQWSMQGVAGADNQHQTNSPES